MCLHLLLTSVWAAPTAAVGVPCPADSALVVPFSEASWMGRSALDWVSEQASPCGGVPVVGIGAAEACGSGELSSNTSSKPEACSSSRPPSTSTTACCTFLLFKLSFLQRGTTFAFATTRTRIAGRSSARRIRRVKGRTGACCEDGCLLL